MAFSRYVTLSALFLILFIIRGDTKHLIPSKSLKLENVLND